MALDLTRGAVWRVIPAFALPLLVGNLTQQVYNLTDSVIVGRFLGKEALAAVSASFFIYYFIISLAIGVGAASPSSSRSASAPAITRRCGVPSRRFCSSRRWPVRCSPSLASSAPTRSFGSPARRPR